MSLARKIGIAFGGFLLSVFLVSTILMFSLAQITTAENLKPIVSNIAVKSFMENMTADQASAIYSELTVYCESTGSENVTLPVGQQVREVPISCDELENTTAANINELFPIPIALSQQEKELVYLNLSNECNRTGYDTVYYGIKTNDTLVDNLTVTCSEVKTTNPEELGRVFGGAIFDKLYLIEPDCSYPGCFFEEKTGTDYFIIFLSAKAHEFYTNIFYLLLVLTVIMAAVVIKLGKSWYNVAKDFGVSLIIAGIPVFGMGFIKSSMPQELVELIGSTADMMFQNLTNNFLFVFIIGVMLLIIGFIGSKYSKKAE